MIIVMLAAAMTVAMLAATAIGLHNEAQTIKLDARQQSLRRYRMG
jgi:lipopolysaccharide export system protein LptA